MPVIAEGSTYRNNRRDGSCSVGTSWTSTDYFLAEGSTAWGFTTYILIQNPNDQAADFTLTYQTAGGLVAQPSFSMPPNSRRTVRVNDVMQNTNFSTRVHGSVPIIAERSMYWGKDTPAGEACHASIGLPGPHMTFILPDGQTSQGMETYTLVQNPEPGAVTVQITYMTPSGKGNISFTDEIAPGSRKTYNMADKIPSDRASIMVKSLDGARPIMVERSIYGNRRGSGTETIGIYTD